MSNIAVRTITGALFVSIVLGSVVWSPYPFAALFLIFTALGLWEYYKVMRNKLEGVYFIFGLFAGLIMYLTLTFTALSISSPYILLINLLTLIFTMIIAVFSDGKHSIEGLGITFLGIVYIAMPFGLLNFLTDEGVGFADKYNAGFLVGFFIIQWVYDIFAYLGGRFFGQHRLLPEISPNKTWEGIVVGGLFAVASTLFLNFVVLDLGLIHWISIAIIIIIFGTLGDLAESMIKRFAEVKDTGNIFPGHGGVLDRFDGLLFSTPAVFIYYMIIL